MNIDDARLPNREEKASQSAIGIDVKSYRERFPEPDMTDEAYETLLMTMAIILKSFVDFGFDTKICEQMLQRFNEIAALGLDGVPSSRSTISEMPSDGGKDGFE